MGARPDQPEVMVLILSDEFDIRTFLNSYGLYRFLNIFELSQTF